MKSLYSAGSRYSFGVLAVIIVALVMSGQGMGRSKTRTGYPTDWSHHHLIFSAPANARQAVSIGKNPRYQQQWYRRNASPSLGGRIIGGGVGVGAGIGGSSFSGWRRNSAGSRNQNGLRADWHASLGPGASVGAGQYPAKFSFDINTANCADAPTPDYVVFNTGVPSDIEQASIVAFDNIYSGCASAGSVPNVYWAFNTGGTALTSTVLSSDGTQVAFVQSDGITGKADLVVLRWATGGTVEAPASPTAVAPGSYVGCTTPCMTVVPLAPANIDSNSAPFYDYAEDALYVGDDGGVLHQVTGVFNGTPTESTTGGFPLTLAAGVTLTSPVFDQNSGKAFIGGSNGILYAVTVSSGAVTASGIIATGAGIVSSPVVDSTVGVVYAFVGQDNHLLPCVGGSIASPCNGVYQFLTAAFVSGGIGVEVPLGPATIPTVIYNGDFDNAFFTSSTSTGGMYTCGSDSTGANLPSVYLLPMTGGLATTAIGGLPPLTSVPSSCSPLTEFFKSNVSGGTDSIYVSVSDGGLGAACGLAGCVNNAVITPWKPNNPYTVGQIVLDSNFFMEVVTVAGTSGPTEPLWNAALSATTTDGSVTWIDQGEPTGRRPGAWSANHVYAVNDQVFIFGNLQTVTTAGTSGTTSPIFAPAPGATTTDNTVIWTNLGKPSAFSFEASGGTSGIIIDNVVPATTVGGASQIYFGNLGQGSPLCGSSTGNGCAIQVSQHDLQ